MNCELGYRTCTNDELEMREDPYEADVDNTPGVYVFSCPTCIDELADDI